MQAISANVEKQEIKRQWSTLTSELFVNLGYLPLTIHWCVTLFKLFYTSQVFRSSCISSCLGPLVGEGWMTCVVQLTRMAPTICSTACTALYFWAQKALTIYRRAILMQSMRGRRLCRAASCIHSSEATRCLHPISRRSWTFHPKALKKRQCCVARHTHGACQHSQAEKSPPSILRRRINSKV